MKLRPRLRPHGVMATVVLLAGVLSACGASSSGSNGEGGGALKTRDMNLSFGWFPAFHTAPVFVAECAGYWEDQNLNVEMISGDSGATLANLLSAGQVDLTYGSIESVARAQDEGRELIQISPMVSQFTLNTVVRDEKLEELGVSASDPIEDRLKAFAKMKIGYTVPGAPTESYARLFMEMVGVDPDKDGTLVAIGSAANLLAALKSGQIDAFMLTPPTSNVPEVEGFGTVFIRGTTGDVPELANMPDTGVGARKDWVEKEGNREAAIRFLVGMIRGIELIHSDQETALDCMEKYFPDMDAQTMKIGLDEITSALPKRFQMDEATVAKNLSVLIDGGILKLEEDPSSAEGVLWTDDLLVEAQRRAEAQD